MKIQKDKIAQFITECVSETFTTVSASIVINFRAKSTNMKFIQNFAHILPHSICGYAGKILMFTQDKEAQYEDKNVIDGFSIDSTKIKRNYTWALTDFNISDNKKYYSNLNRKSILPNNIGDYHQHTLPELVKLIRDGKMIKVYQMNNTINIVVGTSKDTADHICENLESVLKFLYKKNLMATRVYLNFPMKKSITL